MDNLLNKKPNQFFPNLLKQFAESSKLSAFLGYADMVYLWFTGWYFFILPCDLLAGFLH
jgi:hypothetical protein